MKNKKLSGSGPSLWKRAKKSIPGGNMLFSKRSEMFLPDLWPSYFKKAKGYNVWGLDNKKYIDMIFAVGTCTLGYANSKVDKFVLQKIKEGNMTSLNAPEEVYLAEKLLELHLWADMVRFARSGGEANSIAIRIARAASGKDGVAFCGYHGWHDWYLSSNLSEKNSLNTHLLNDLPIAGVPKNLINTSFPFMYNDFEGLKKIILNNEIGVIKMEVKRNIEPSNNFLKKVRDLATKKKIVLIFDECTSGFRECYGGLHKNYDVNPDIAMFGKAIGNGYAITAVVGKREIMEAAQNTFISSTFWTERVGSVAGLATLEVMHEMQSWKHIVKTGKNIIERWKNLSLKYNLEIEITGSTGIPSFVFPKVKHQIYKTYLTQKMLSRGFLCSTQIYISTAHTQKIINLYFNHLEEIFSEFAKYELTYFKKKIKHNLCHQDFRRIN